jgi:hypothetical protein
MLNLFLKPLRRCLCSGIVSACGAMGREIESRQGIDWVVAFLNKNVPWPFFIELRFEATFLFECRRND